MWRVLAPGQHSSRCRGNTPCSCCSTCICCIGRRLVSFFFLGQWVQISSRESNKIKWVHVSPMRLSESMWIQVMPSESKWVQLSGLWVQISSRESNKIKWVHVSPMRLSESMWVQVMLSESKWFQLSASKCKWIHTSLCMYTCAQDSSVYKTSDQTLC